MKIKIDRLREIIQEELQKETQGPLDFSKGRDPAVTQTPDLAAVPAPAETPAPTSAPEEPASDDLRVRLSSMLESYIKVSTADPRVPQHVLYAFNRLAEEVAKG